jgi:PAS domain S-box-containing protein
MLHFADVRDDQLRTVSVHASVAEAIAPLQQSPEGALFVIDPMLNGELVGVLTERDIVRSLALSPDLQQHRVGQVMRSSPCVTQADLEDPTALLALFQHHQVPRLPIINATNQPIGWLTWKDLLQTCQATRLTDAARFRSLFEQAAVGVAQVSLEGRWLLVNQAFCSMLGYLVDEILEMREDQIIYASDIPATQMYYQSLLAGDAKSYSLEERFVRKDGSVVWVNTSTSLVTSAANEPQYFIKIVKDISERKQAETALRRQLNRALLLQKVTDAIRSQLDPQQVFEVTVTQVGQAFNANRCLLMTYKTDPHPQFFVAAEYVDPGDAPLAMRTLFFKKNAYATKILAQDQAIASPNVYADSLLQPMAALCQQFGLKSMLTVRTSYQGEPNGAITLHQCDRFREWTRSEIRLLEEIAAQVGIALAQVRLLHQEKAQRQAINEQNMRLKQEIHKRKRIEAALSRSHAALQAQQEAALDGILMVDENRQVISFNQRFCEVWKIPSEMMAQSDSVQLSQHILSQVAQPADFLQWEEYLYSHPLEVSQEEIGLKTGRVLERYSAPVQSAQGEHYGRVWFFRDISERKQAERQLAQRQHYLAVLVDVQRYLLAANSTPTVYAMLLEHLGQASGADRVYLFENHFSAEQKLCMSQRMEWQKEGTHPEIDNPTLQNLAYEEGYIRWAKTLAKGESINGIVADFPAAERALLEAQDIQAILILPLLVNQTFWGFIGFDNCVEARQWTDSEVSLLSVAASAISLHQERQQAEAALRESIQRERATLRVIERMRQTLDLDQVFNTTVEELRQLLRCDRTLIFRFNADWSGEVMAESCDASWTPLLNNPPARPTVSREICKGDRCRLQEWGLPYVSATPQPDLDPTQVENRYTCRSDVEQSHFSEPYLSFLKGLQAKAYVAVPIYLGNQLWGLLAGYQNSQPRHWEISETNLVMHISTQLGIALQQADLFTQIQKQSADLEKARDAAEAANRAKSEFLANISHELRTPLNAILGFTQVMSHDVTNPKHQEYISIINRSGKHLLKLINDVLEMSKIEAGRHRLNSTQFDLYHLLDTLHEMLLLKAQMKQLKLSFQIAPEVPQYIKTDEGKLCQVLLNLLGNAIKFTDVGQVTLRVCKQPQSNSPTAIALRFEVEDSGLGMTAEEVKELFIPFAQAYAGQQSSEGTGLGLAISQKFVQLMGGTIAVESTPHQGSCFCFDIVVIPVSSPSVAIAPPSQRIISLAPDQPTYRILVVEDRPENRQLLMELLAPLGFDVRLVTNGAEGIESWRNWHPHLIFMDMRMPVMDGYQATRRIRAEEQALRVALADALTRTYPPPSQPFPTKIIAVTSNAFEEDRIAILANGCNDFISKPFQEEIMFLKLQQHLGVRYVYDKSESFITNHASFQAPDQNLLLRALKTMSETWINQLWEAAIQGRDTIILELIRQIPQEHGELINELERLNQSFQFEHMINLLSS